MNLMASQKINFEYTPQIQRYLDEMISYWNENRANMPKSQIQFAEPLEIQTYLKHERGNEADEDNRWEFSNWLEKTSSVEFLYRTEDDGHQGEKTLIAYPTTFHVRIRDIKPILELHSTFTDSKTGIETEDNGRVLFFNEGTGKFLCGKRRVELKTDETKPYYKFLVAIYLSAGENGDTTVSEIRRVLRTRFKLKHAIERKDVQNHINNSIKRLLKSKVPADLSMFEWTKGTDKLFFNNSKL